MHYKNFLEWRKSNDFIDQSLFVKEILSRNNIKLKVISDPRYQYFPYLSMLHYFFADKVNGVETKDLFTDLAIGNYLDAMAKQGQYKVVCLDWRDFDATKHDFYDYLYEKMVEQFNQHTYVLESVHEIVKEEFMNFIFSDIKNQANFHTKLEGSLSLLTKCIVQHQEKVNIHADEQRPVVLVNTYHIAANASQERFMERFFYGIVGGVDNRSSHIVLMGNEVRRALLPDIAIFYTPDARYEDSNCFFNLPQQNDFVKLIRSGTYIDRTEFIARILWYRGVHRCAYPHNTGKSVLLQTLAAFLQGSVNGTSTANLFQGLAVSKDVGTMEKLGKFEVIYLNLSDIATSQEPIAEFMYKKMSAIYFQYAHIYRKIPECYKEDFLRFLQPDLKRDRPSNTDVQSALGDLHKWVTEYNYQKEKRSRGPVILIDGHAEHLWNQEQKEFIFGCFSYLKDNNSGIIMMSSTLDSLVDCEPDGCFLIDDRSNQEISKSFYLTATQVKNICDRFKLITRENKIAADYPGIKLIYDPNSENQAMLSAGRYEYHWRSRSWVVVTRNEHFTIGRVADFIRANLLQPNPLLWAAPNKALPPSKKCKEAAPEKPVLKKVPKKFRCILTEELMTEPTRCSLDEGVVHRLKEGKLVTERQIVAERVYERKEIENWLTQKGTSPFTRQPLPAGQAVASVLRSDKTLAEELAQFRKDYPKLVEAEEAYQASTDVRNVKP